MSENMHLYAAASRRAGLDVERYRREPAALADLPLGRYADTGVRNLLARRLLLRVPWFERLFDRAAAPGADDSRLTQLLGEVAYWRAARRLLSAREWTDLTHGPVVLMYHAIGRRGEKVSRYITSGRAFKRHVAWLKRRRYHFLSLRELAECRTGGLPPARSVVLTFDDGYADNLDALREEDIPATIFVVTGAAGCINEWDREGPLHGRALFGWEGARAAAQRGVEIGGHSRSHPDLTRLDADGLKYEVRRCLDDLSRELGAGNYTFAYPHGRFDLKVRAAVENAEAETAEARFVGAACSRGGVNDPFVSPYELRRVEIKGTDSLLSFVLMVRLGRRITPLQLLRSLLVG